MRNKLLPYLLLAQAIVLIGFLITGCSMEHYYIFLSLQFLITVAAFFMTYKHATNEK